MSLEMRNRNAMMRIQPSDAIKANLVALTAVALVATSFGQAYPPCSPDQAWLSNLAYLDTSGSASSVIPFGRDINNVIPRIAQGFQTGANPDGYLVSSVTLA